jgi:hypothetical protein
MTTRRTTLVLCALVTTLSLLAACGDDSTDSGSGDTTSTTSTSTTTSSSTTTTEPAPADATPVVWPPADGSISYDDPVEAATGFAVDLVGFTDPVVGEFQQGDTRSGEVEVRPTATGPATVVLVRQVGDDDTWSVIGATTESIVPTTPAPGDVVRSPVQLGGTSTAFEGNVQVEVVGRRTGEPLGSGFVTGGSMGEMGPFAGEVAFSGADTDDGAVVFLTRSEEDGSVWDAAVVPVTFSPGG